MERFIVRITRLQQTLGNKTNKLEFVWIDVQGFVMLFLKSINCSDLFILENW